MRNSAADRRPDEKGPRQHREDAEPSLQRRAAGGKPEARRPQPQRRTGHVGGAAGGTDRQEGRQHLRYVERQRSDAMTRTPLTFAPITFAPITFAPRIFAILSTLPPP